jgi:cytochrome P450
LIAASDPDDPHSGSEIVSNVAGLLFAGHETTTNLIGNGVLTLLRHPEQMQRLRDDPALIESAVEEMLRYESPVQWIARRAKEPLEIGGRRIATGQLVGLFLGAANRDPAQFPDPDRFDVARREGRHLAFAHGIHFCLGAALARLEGQIAIGTLLRRLPELRLAPGPVEWRENFSMRGLQDLRVTF